MKPFRVLLLALSIALLISLDGCSTPQSRAEETSTVFAALPKKFKDAALKGELREGMNSDAVFVALGKPSRVLDGVEKGRKLERWIYTRIQSDEIPSYREAYERDSNGRILVFQRYDPIRITRAEDTFEVKFENDKVIGWQKL